MRLRTPVRAAVLFAAQAILMATVSGSAYADGMAGTPQSHGTYRLPFADGTQVKVFWDFTTHRPPGRVDILAINGSEPYRVAAAAAGRVAAIEDRYSKRQSGGPGVVCQQNYVWIAHPNGEWTNYSHLAQDSATKKAGLKIGDAVRAGQYLGNEGEVGCAMFKHVHFEVAVPDPKNPLDSGGFLTDNENAKRERNPRFCGVAGDNAVEGQVYAAIPCQHG
jgi:hypothetical protein